jgi:adenine-specific DNA methylase
MKALAPYLGSKGALIKRLAGHLPPPTASPRLLDVFCGSCAISLWAKRRGFAVKANDLADRAVLPAKALVANSRVRLGREDLLRLFVEDDGAPPGFIEAVHGGHSLPVARCRFLDQAFGVARELREPLRSLTLFLLLRYVQEVRGLPNWGARRIIEQLDERHFEEINRNYLRDRLVRAANSHPLPLLESLRAKINDGIFAGNGEAFQLDALEFLATNEGDVVVMDPPYASTSGYERSLKTLDSILAGRVVESTPSVFSGRRGIEALERLFEAARHIPYWLITYGNRVMSAEELQRMAEKHRRHVRVEIIRYAHFAGLASEASKERNREIVISAWGDR